jgi:hypothetical protein
MNTNHRYSYRERGRQREDAILTSLISCRNYEDRLGRTDGKNPAIHGSLHTRRFHKALT